jgi:hypothetical protein
MNQRILLRALGLCLAVGLALGAIIGFYSDLMRPSVQASDLFSGNPEQADVNVSSSGVAALVSFDGDLLASQAAAKAAAALHHPSIDATSRAAQNRTAQDASITVLKVSPIRPALWLALGMLKAQSGEPVTPVLKASYLTGSVPVEVAFSRVQTVTSTSAADDEEIRLLAQSDIRSALANRARFDAPLIATYVQATPQGKSLLLEATQIADPKFNATLRRY